MQLLLDLSVNLTLSRFPVSCSLTVSGPVKVPLRNVLIVCDSPGVDQWICLLKVCLKCYCHHEQLQNLAHLNFTLAVKLRLLQPILDP